jgi:hypothetical protein
MQITEVHVSAASKHKSELEKIIAAADQFRPENAFIAGGSLTSAFTGQAINDVDFYFRSKADFQRAIEDAYDDGLWCVAATDRAVTFVRGPLVVQLMCFDFFASPVEIFDAFDFTACMAAFDIERQQFVFHEDFLKHAAQRYLKFHSGTRYPFGSLLRVLKYQSRGYSLGKSDLLRISLCCHSVPLQSWDDLAKAIGGQYGEKVNLDASQPFSIEAALRIFENTDITIPTTPEEMPGSAEELLVKIGMPLPEPVAA